MKRRFRIGFLCALILSVFMFIGCVNAEKVALNEIDSTFNASNLEQTYLYDIRINPGTEDEFITTYYKKRGYWVRVKVGSYEKTIYSLDHTLGTPYTIGTTGITVTLSTVQSEDKKSVTIGYTINNTTGTEKEVQIGVTADTQIGIDRGLSNGDKHFGLNDRAAISRSSDEEHTRFVLVQDSDDTTMKYDETFKAKITVELTPKATTTWIGNYYYKDDNVFVNGDKNSLIKADDVDTAFAYSWTVTVPANGSETVSSKYILSEAETTNVSFYRYNNHETPFEVKEVPILGGVEFPSLTSSSGYTWNTKKDGSGTSYEYNYKGVGVLVESGPLSFYEIKEGYDPSTPDPDPPATTEYYVHDFPEEGANIPFSLLNGVDDLKVHYMIDDKNGYIYKGIYNDENYTEEFTGDTLPEHDLYVLWVKSDAVVSGRFMDEVTPSDYVDFNEIEEVLLVGVESNELRLVVNDITSIIEKSEKEEILKNFKKNQKPLMYFDASLYNVFIYGPNQDDIMFTVINETKKEMKLGIVLSDDLELEDKDLCLVRYHDKKVEIIPGKIEIIDGKRVLTFKTNKFSTYALAYTDILKTGEEEIAPNPKTGDLILGYLVLFVSSTGVILYMNNKRKINN